MKEVILLMHPMLGVLGIVCAIWVVVETLNASIKNKDRLRFASLLVPIFMSLTWIVSGYWYVTYYAVDKAVILKGPWAFAHNIFMETKEHMFFVTLVLSILLPLITYYNNLVTNKSARQLVYVVAGIIILTGMAIEGAGGVISMAAKLGFIQAVGAK